MEPMTLGSPTTQHQHSPANQSGVLPGFLLGEPSHQQRTNTFSPTKKTLSFVTSPQSGIHHNMYASPPSSSHQDSMNPRSPFNQSGMGQQQQLQQTKLFKYHPTSHDNSINAPPAVDLFDSLRDERSSPPKAQGMNVTSPFHQSQQHTLQQSQFGESYMDNSGFNVSRVMSPIQNASMHENRSKAPFNSFWVTVFGFPPSSVATILSHFAQCGTIVDKMFSPQNGNWIHLRFSSRIECDKALNYNGKIIANGLMIGVVQCTDQSIINEDVLREDRENITKMRPLSRVTYDTTQSPTKVDPQVFAPKMNNGIVSKALDMFFGW
ncbi:nucleoporin Nup35 [Culicoides brevitarsis]|uniref:nucleoporin Nup35 n=1 Tax=Culicoides brevitarsis TaxID=469753 RepID=UPI00307BC44D